MITEHPAPYQAPVSLHQAATALYGRDISDLMTEQQQNEFNLELSRHEADALIPLISMSMIASVVCDRTRQMVQIIRESSTLIGRGKNQVISDMSTPRALTICDSIERSVFQFYDAQVTLLDKSDYFRAVEKQTGTDIAEGWAKATEMFLSVTRPCIRNIDKALKTVLKPVVRPLDNVAFNCIVRLLFLAEAFCNFRISFRGIQPVEHARCFAPIDIVGKIRELFNAIELRDVDGYILLFLYSREDRKKWLQSESKKWYGKHRREEYTPIDILLYFNHETPAAAGYELSRTLFYMPNIDNIVQQSFGYDPEFRKAFRRGCWLSCMKSFEQYTCMITIRNSNYKSLIPKLERFLRKVEAENAGRKRKAKPLVGFKCYDKKKFKFLGIWHSAYEASIECGSNYFSVLQALTHNTKFYGTGRYQSDEDSVIWIPAHLFLDNAKAVVENSNVNDYNLS